MPPHAHVMQRTPVARVFFIALGFVLIAACGQTGPLYQPEPEEQPAPTAPPVATPDPGTSDP